MTDAPRGPPCGTALAGCAAAHERRPATGPLWLNEHVQQPQVVVLGAGPTGVLAATLLGQQGVQTLVLDRRAEVHAQPRAVHLDDEVYRLLHRVGAGEGFARISRPVQGLRLLDGRHRTIAQFDRSADQELPQANLFDQPELEALLRTRMRAQPGVGFRGGVEVVRVAPDVVYLDLRTGEQHTVRARFVLAADGAGSLARAAIGASMVDLGFEQRWLVVDVRTRADLGQWDGVHQVCGAGRAATFMRIGAWRYRWEFRLLDGETAADYRDPGRLLPLLAPWTGSLPAHELEVVRVADYVFRAQVADRWRRGPVFLLGDAAHLTPPFIGQGLGAGLRDADNLAWKLAAVLRGELPERALDSYQAERSPHAVAVIRLAVLLGRVMTGGGAAGDLLRRVVAPRLHLVPGLRARVLDSRTPALHRSALVRRGRLAGQLVPNLATPDGRRLDDVAPGRLRLLTTRPVRPAPGVEVVAVTGSPLGDWLREHGSRAVVVRPDGTVLASTRGPAHRLMRSVPQHVLE